MVLSLRSRLHPNGPQQIATGLEQSCFSFHAQYQSRWVDFHSRTSIQIYQAIEFLVSLATDPQEGTVRSKVVTGLESFD